MNMMAWITFPKLWSCVLNSRKSFSDLIFYENNLFQLMFMVWKNSYSCCFYSVPQLGLILCNPIDYNMPGFPVLHCLSEFVQIHVHPVMDESVMPSNHLILCCPLLLPSVFPSCPQPFPASGSFPMSWLCISWPKYWSFSFNPSNEYSATVEILIYCAVVLKLKHDVIQMPKSYKYLRSSNPKYKKLYARHLFIFGSAYISKQLFSIMK